MSKQTPSEKIDDFMKDMTHFFKQYINKKGVLPTTIFLFDENGAFYAVPMHELEKMMTFADGKMMNDILKMYIRYMKEDRDINIIQSGVFETVFYTDTEESEDKKMGFMIIHEYPEEIKISMYGLDDKNKVYNEPVEEMTFDKSHQRFDSQYAHIIKS